MKYTQGKEILAAVETGELPAETIDKLRAGETTIGKEARLLKEKRNP